MMDIKAIIFDFGGVLIDWSPAYYYSNIFEDEKQMEWFLNNICTNEWNLEQDRGRSFAEGIKILKNKYPTYTQEIKDFINKWEYMLKGEIPGTVHLLNALKKKYKIYGLTNWSSETFPIALERFDFLHSFDGIVVSGEEGLVKPDKQIFRLLLDRYELDAANCVFIDDNINNIESAKEIGFNVIHFTSSEGLEKELEAFGVVI